MIKLHLTKVGTPKTITTKYGDKQKSYVKATEYGDNFLNYWLSSSTEGWREGQVVEVESVEEGEYLGKPQYTIRMPKVDNRAPAPQSDAIKFLDERLKKAEQRLELLAPMYREWKAKDLSTTSAGDPMPNFGEEPDYADKMMEESNAF